MTRLSSAEFNNGHTVAAAVGGEPVALNAGFDTVTFAVITAALIGLCILLSAPFLPAIAWGVALAIIVMPLHRWVNSRVQMPGLAAGASTLVVVALIVTPGIFVAYQLAQEVRTVATQVSDPPATGQLRQRLSETPALSWIVEWMDRVNLDVETEIHRMVGENLPDISRLANGTFALIIQLLTAVFIIFYLLRDHRAFIHGVRDLLPLSRVECEGVFTRASDSVHANLHASVITSLIDSVSSGLLFWWLGLPSPVLWGAIMFVLALLPMVGAAFVWVPAAAYLFLWGRPLAGVGLVAWGLTLFIFIDNLLYVRLAGERMRLHAVPALISFLGGLALFGVSGMILGPAILAVTVAVLEVWRVRRTGVSIPPSQTGAEPSRLIVPHEMVEYERTS